MQPGTTCPWREWPLALRSLADVPNRIVRLALRAAGREHDLNRRLTPYRSLTPAFKARFEDVCAHCGLPPAKWVEEHLVPMNRVSVGLHSWGNVVPTCKGCNDLEVSGP